MIRLIMLSLILSITYAFSSENQIEETINQIQIERNAICEFARNSASRCFNYACRQNLFYSCESNEGNFRLKLVISYSDIYGEIRNTKVRRIVYYTN